MDTCHLHDGPLQYTSSEALHKLATRAHRAPEAPSAERESNENDHEDELASSELGTQNAGT